MLITIYKAYEYPEYHKIQYETNDESDVNKTIHSLETEMSAGIIEDFQVEIHA